MPFYKKTKNKFSIKMAPPRGGARGASPSFKKSKAKSASELRNKSGGRRVADRLKPLLAKVVSVVSSDSIIEAFFNLTDDILQQATQDGMTTLKEDGIQKILQGECDFKQVSAVCVM